MQGMSIVMIPEEEWLSIPVKLTPVFRNNLTLVLGYF
jgi:hypothetical protein